ncbi:SAVMC3_10250 family protein [Embleya hyalina]|uniref:SAVMC3_10250 family protein n=1 Tax=Embleya hyalina TaxID=516124 RepID=UPI000F8255A7|nr:SAVMC3_10250 family protein [Embleya hyalina]
MFVHGLFSSARTWSAFRGLIEADSDLAGINPFHFEYPSPKLRLSPLKRIPDFDTLADGLGTFLGTLPHSRVVLVSHSQGGLIVQRHLARTVMHARGRELARIACVVMFACPNSGSQLFQTLRRAAARGFLAHPQERALRPLDDAVHEAQRVVLNRVVHADAVASDRCPVRVYAYAGDQDNVVTPASARGVFPDTGVLPGDHFSIIRPDSADHLAYRVLKTNIVAAAGTPAPAGIDAEVRDYVYVSARKVGRIARVLGLDVGARTGSIADADEPPWWKTAAGGGGRAEDVIGLVPDVENALGRGYGVKDIDDDALGVGHWFRLRGVPMVFCLPESNIEGVLFVGETSGIRFALGGSAEYLLDRPTRPLVVDYGRMAASGLPGTLAMLRKIVDLERRGTVEPKAHVEFLTADDGRSRILSSEYEWLLRRLKSGWHPMTALARCLHVDTTPDGARTVLATPLYVTFSVPE